MSLDHSIKVTHNYFEDMIRFLDMQTSSMCGLRLVYSIVIWKACREAGYGIAQWTDEEIECRDPETGEIGTLEGVDCYVQKPWE